MASSPPFLRLPAELRNTIYELALTATEPLHYHKPEGDGRRPYLYFHFQSHDTPGGQVDDEKAVKYNQLKFVNKQLYAETVSLELKFNDIVFWVGSIYEKPSELVIDWVSSIPNAKRCWIRTINIKYDPYHCSSLIPEDSTTIAHLTQICKNTPTMKIKYYLPAWKFGPPYSGIEPSNNAYSFFHAAEQIRYSIRGKGFKYVSCAVRSAIRYAGMWRDHHGQSVPLAYLQAKNLSYFPAIPEGAQIPIIKESLFWAKDDEDIPQSEQWIGNKYPKDWMEHGI